MKGLIPNVTSKQIVLDYFKCKKIQYAVGALVIIATDLCMTYIPKLTGEIFDMFELPGMTVDQILASTGLLALVAVGMFVFRFCWRYLIVANGRGIEMTLRDHLFGHLQTLSSDFYVKHNTGDIITRCISDVQATRMMFSMGLANILDVVMINAVSITNMFLTANPVLTLLAVIPIPILLFVLVKLRLLIRKRFMVVQRSVSDISSKVQENITGIRVVKSFAQEDSESEIFSELSLKKWSSEMSMVRVSSLIGPIVQITFGVVFTVFLIFGGKLVIEGQMSIGDYIAFNGYIGLLMSPVQRLARIIQVWQRATVSMQRLDMILSAKPTVDDKKADPRVASLPDSSIEFRNFTYCYPETNVKVLKNLNFTVKNGETLAVMGPTGCGKSTITNLLMRLWNLPDGGVFIGGHDVNTIPLDVLRNSTGYVPQDTLLFSDSIMNNIRFFSGDISEDDARAAARAACVDDNITAFPDGYDTVVGERGMTLSGGQKQRIAIARAIARRPRLLLLDDCLSAVDAETEQDILRNLGSVMDNCTTVMITHRVSAAMLCDHILFLAPDGSVSGFGTHESLYRDNAEYRHIVDMVNDENELMQDDSAAVPAHESEVNA